MESTRTQFTNILIFLLGLMLAATGIAKPSNDSIEGVSAVTVHNWAHIKLSGDYPERAQLPGFFAAVSESLDEMISRLDKAATDESIDGVLLEVSNVSIGWAKLNEIHAAIDRLKSNKVPVYGWTITGNTMDYLIASRADRLYMPESSTLMLLGLRAEVSFYRNLLDKLEVQPDILRVGKYKSAAEPYSRTEMSPEFRQEMEAVLDDYYQQMVNMIASSRSIPAEKVSAAIDSGPHMATAARQLGLLDEVIYRDQIESVVTGGKEGHILYLSKDYGKQEYDDDFSGFGGMMKLFEVLTGQGSSKQTFDDPTIAVIYGTGAIVTGESTSSGFGGETSLGSETLIKAIRKASNHSRVKAIVLRVDSPGGSALASDMIWRELETVDIPVVVSMGDVAASGGYYISMGADRIFAEPGTITGSIGVVGGKLALEGLMEKVGITTTVISRGANSGSMSSLHTFSDSERISMTRILEEIYNQFTSKAAEGRSMPLGTIRELAQGRIYTGNMALKNGLVDEIGTIDDAITHAREMAGIDPDTEIDKMVLPRAQSPFEQWFGSMGGVKARGLETLYESLRAIAPELAEPLKLLSTVNLLATERVLTMMPFSIRIR